MINMIPKRKLGCLTLGQLPTSYRESMSYEEQVLWLCNIIENEITPKVNELINIVDNIDINFDEINEKIDIIQNDIMIIQNEYRTLNSKVNQNTEDIQALDIRITNEINDLDSTLRELINSNYNTLKNYVDYQDNILNEKIDNIQIGAINVYDPTTGLLSPLQIVINNLYQIGNKDGLTASEFDTLELTASGFDAYEITAYEFDSQGRLILT